MENQQQSSAAAEAEAEKTHTDTHQNSALINSFCEITCASQSEALFFLESHNFDLDAAVSTFLESTNPTITAAAAAVVSGAAATNPIQSPSRSRSRSPSYSPSLSESSLSPSRSRSPSPHRSRHAQCNLRSSKAKAPSASATGGGAGRRAGGGGGGVRTLADLNRGTNDDGPDSDPEYQPPEYYTGGEKSGMLVQDPSKGNDVDAIFNDARQLGALEGSVENHRPSSSSKSFTGTGRLLSGETVLPAPQQPEERTHNIIFWNNGFTVNDGPLRRFDDPENASFLESIRRSECPKELEPSDKRSAVHVSLIRKEENCPVLEKRKAPFQGVGRTLGSTSNTTSTEPTAADTSLTTAPAPSMGLVVDETLPTTSIQLRLGDGTRMVSRFNYHHTIRDIRGFIDASRPGGPRTYQLQTVGFPPKQLTDLDQTIEQAGLANSVVIQKLS